MKNEQTPKHGLVRSALDFLQHGPTEETDLDLLVQSLIPHLLFGRELKTRQAHDLRFLPKGYVYNTAESPEQESRNLFRAGKDEFVTITGGVPLADLLEPEKAAWLRQHEQKIGTLLLDPNATWQDCQRDLRMLVKFLNFYLLEKRLKTLRLVGRVGESAADGCPTKSIEVYGIPRWRQDTIVSTASWPVELYGDVGGKYSQHCLASCLDYTKNEIGELLRAANYNFQSPPQNKK